MLISQFHPDTVLSAPAAPNIPFLCVSLFVGYHVISFSEGNIMLMWTVLAIYSLWTREDTG